MDVVDFAKHVYKQLQEREQELSSALVAGTPKDWESYKTMQTQGGVYIPDEVREREAVATVVAYVLRIGPLAYDDPDKFGPDSEPWCQQGDWVCIGRYAGSRFKIDGGEVRVINDDEVIATISDPQDIKSV